MDFGVHVGTRGVGATPEGLQAIAHKMEELGFAYLGFPDHVVIPGTVDSKYPYNKEGQWPAQDTGTCLEQLMTIGYVSAVTEKIRLLTSVMVLPHRPAVLAAKMLTTADILSKGRLTVGLGIGWMKEEIATLGGLPYGERAQGAEEFISVFRALWMEQSPSFQGKFANFEPILFDPKPVQKPHPPIWMGGESAPALDRTARVANGWYPVIANPRHPLKSPVLYQQMLEEVKNRMEQFGRKSETLQTALYVPWYQHGIEVTGSDGERCVFTGSTDQIAKDIRDYQEAGLQHLIVGFESHDLGLSLERIEQFSLEVIPRSL